MENDCMGPLVRSYVGIRIPDGAWPKLQETQMVLKRKSASDVCRWSSQADMMLPLCAIGDQPWERVKWAAAQVAPVCAKYPPLNLKLEGLQGIPNLNQPRYVAIGITGDLDTLKRLREEIARAIGPLLAPSEREFAPQLVIGRLKAESEQGRTALGRAVRMTASEILFAWQVPAIELLRADASTTGVQYQSIEKFNLAAPAAV